MDENTAEHYYEVGIIEFKNHQYDKSLNAFEQCDALRDKDPDYVGITSNTKQWIAHLHHLMGNDKKAELTDVYYYQFQPVDHRTIENLLSFDRKISSLKKQSDYSSMLKLRKQHLQEEESVLGHNHYYIANSYFEIAESASNTLAERGDAMGYYQKALQIFNSYGAIGRNAYQLIQIEMAAHLLSSFQTALAEKYIPQKEVLISQHIPAWYLLETYVELIKSNPDGIIDLGKEYFQTEESKTDSVYFESIADQNITALTQKGYYSDALDLSKRLSEFRKLHFGESSVQYLRSILQTGSIYAHSNRIFEELFFYIESYSAISQTLDSFDNLLESNKHEELELCVRLFERISSIFKSVGFAEEMNDIYDDMAQRLTSLNWQQYKDNPAFESLQKLYEISLCGRADNYATQKNLPKAIEIYEEILSLRPIINRERYYEWMNNCGNLYLRAGDVKKGIRYLEDVLLNYPDKDGILRQNLAVGYVLDNPLNPRIAELEKESFSLQKSHIYSSLFFKNDFERSILWNSTYLPIIQGFTVTSNMCGGANGEVNKIAYNSLLLGHGFLLSTQSEMSKTVRNCPDKSIPTLIDSIQVCQHNINSVSSNSFLYSSLLLEKGNMESRLFEKLSHNPDQFPITSISYDDIKNSLSTNSIAVEFFYSKPGLNDDPPQYYAFIAKKDVDFPLYVKIDLPTDFDKKADLYLNPKYSSIVWDEIIAKSGINAGDSIYFSADGILHSIGIENLNYAGAGEPISEIYTIYRLSSTREICLDKENSNNIKSISLFGGLDYGDSSNKEDNRRKKARGAARGLSPLPETENEVEYISGIAKESGMFVNCYTGTGGTETLFYSLSSKSPSILHFATHGDYLDNGNQAMNSSVIYLSDSEKAFFGECNEPHESDGILSADEISQTNLSSTDMVVLSACNSALGGVGADGVFGLQRGFKLSGVKSLLMSLWKVDDTATCSLMREFYSNWLLKKMTKHQALEAAKKTIRETPGWESPDYWAAFILLDGLGDGF